MTNLQSEYGLPAEVESYVDKGVLDVVSEKPEEKTVIFDVPKLQSIDHLRRETRYSLIWIHPDFNAEFCWYYEETPGDLPNFMVEAETDDAGHQQIDFKTIDDLLSWLQDLED